LPGLRVAGELDVNDCSADGIEMIGAMRPFLFGPLLAAAVALAAEPAMADPHPLLPVPSAEPPAGRVGRIAFVSGKVEWRVAGVAGWSDAAANFPVMAGTAVRTDRKSRAAIEIGADSIALSAGTQVEIAGLDGRAIDLVLKNGEIGLSRSRRSGDDVEIDLPQGGVWVAPTGEYEIESGDPGGQARIAVFAGSARLYAGGAEIGIAAGEVVQLAAAMPFVATIAPAMGGAFAAWWRGWKGDGRDLAAPYFASPEMTGAAALDAAGHWRRSGAYGEVWRPDALPADWVPYRDGRWRWIPPCGWTWIDDQPWGFAPFHYGRWAVVDDRWVWVPGRLAPGGLAKDPVYLPAAVAFLGTAGVGVSYAKGDGPAIGWFPLAPGEAYWPSYSDDLDYIRAANRGVVVDPASIGPEPDGRLPVEVVNRRFANRLAASVVPRSIFVGGQPVAPALIELPKERLQEVPVVMGSPRLAWPAPSPIPPVATAVRTSPPTNNGLAAGAKRAIWLKTVHLAAIRSRTFVQAARLRHLVALNLGAPAVAEPPRLRHLAVLRLAHHHAGHN
jgi:hypothetical protein